MNKLKCQACFTFFSITIGAMLSHLIKVHRNDPNLNITCEVPGCQLTFAKLNSYKSHLHRKHSNIDLKRPLYVEQENELSEFEEEESMDVEDTDHDCDINQDEFLYDELKDRIEADKKMNALYLLKTKECNLLTQKATDDIVEGSTWLVRNTVEMLQQGLQDRLDSAGIDFRAVPGLSELFSEGHPISNPFKYVSTKHKQGNYFKEAFGLVTPRRITLGHSSKKQRVGKQYREVLKEEEMIYIPLLDTLQQMLNQESILNEVQTSHKRNDAMIADFCDGNIFSTHPLFSRDPTALQLMLYYDEVEISNPLGTKTGKHKLGVVYFTLGNIDPKHRSQTNAIQLLAIATTPIIKKYGIDNLLEPFMEDLEKLEQDGGHQFSIKGVPMSFAGSIAFVSGDNLGSQLIGGFKEGSGAFLKCRHCMGNKDDIKTKFCERDFILRTSAGHDQQCQNIERNPDLSKTYGVCRMSVLCNSRYFHVVNGLPGDAMHDILEGILQYQCKEMLNMFIYEDKYFTLDQLNLRLKKFDYGHYNDKNKPSPITAKTLRSDNNSLKQKAAQMWCLGKHLPLIIGSCVPEDDEKWQHFLTLLEIVDLVFAPVTSVNSLGVLEGLIEEYLWQFSILYPGRSIIPKMHYLVHYPTHMYNFGPMVNTWCMRYEAKHRYFKKIAMNMGNFTNVAFTLAERHQLQSCYVMSASKEDQESRFLYKPTTIGHGKQEVVGDTQYFQALKQHQRMIDETDHVYEAKKVTICGTEYRIGSVVFEGLQNRLPRFASVEKIVVLSNDNIWFILKRFLTIKFSQHFHAFQIQRPINADCVLMRQTDFGTYLPAHVTRPLGSVNERSYVAPRYNVPQQ